MASPSEHLTPRYRRRILSLGALATVALFVIGAPIYNNRIEADLEQRVPEALSAAGFDGSTATFDGQDGALVCESPWENPEGALEIAYGVWGVHSVDLDRACRVNQAPIVSPPTSSDDSASSTPATTLSSTPVTKRPSETGSTTPTEPPDFRTVAAMVSGSPQLSLFAVLADEAGLLDMLSDTVDGGITLFAPSDDAFDALPADALALLRADPQLLDTVLRHHVTAGASMTDELATGPLTMFDGSVVQIDARAVPIRVGAGAITTPDLAARNGVVHVIDTVLLPDGLELSSRASFSEVTATLEGGTTVLTGAVASEVERATLVDAAATVGGPVAVIDRLTVDAAAGLDSVTIAQLAQLVGALPADLVSGTAGFDGVKLYVTGMFASDAARDAMTAVGDAVGAAVMLEPRPAATEVDATALEAELNEYVVANPILFQPTSSVLVDSAVPILDRIAQLASAFAGVSITVEGHTDSDGVARENLVLSQRRADAVRDALVARGLDPAAVVAQGFGSETPVLVDGTEDKAASRRVEFRAVATPG
ncbi:MAG: fasciclin domain-containing protein [Ilumatobacteraceae bacterium]